MKQEETDRHSAFVITPQDTRPTPLIAHGAWMGISPQGDVVVHLFVDYPSLPPQWIVRLKEGVIESPHDPSLVSREIVATLMLSPDVAETIAKAMLGAVEKMNLASASLEEDME